LIINDTVILSFNINQGLNIFSFNVGNIGQGTGLHVLMTGEACPSKRKRKRSIAPPPLVARLSDQKRSAESCASLPLFSTGVTSTGAILAPGSEDTHYTVVTTLPAFIAPSVVVTNPTSLETPAWVNNTATSAWISVATGGSTVANIYSYVFLFNLTLDQANNAVIEGSVVAQDSVVVYINSHLLLAVLNVSSPTPWQQFRTFLFNGSSGFLNNGINQLRFDVGALGSPYPSGIQVQLSGYSCGAATPTIPNPGILLGFFIGFLATVVVFVSYCLLFGVYNDSLYDGNTYWQIISRAPQSPAGILLPIQRNVASVIAAAPAVVIRRGATKKRN
jgi:hypothetical protein